MKTNTASSMYSKCITRFRKKQELLSKPYTGKDLHPILLCDIEPDERPFTWPRRKRYRDMTLEEQLELFDTNFFGELI